MGDVIGFPKSCLAARTNQICAFNDDHLQSFLTEITKEFHDSFGIHLRFIRTIPHASHDPDFCRLEAWVEISIPKLLGKS